jgi:type IV secretory pathway TrbD component
MTEKKQYTGHFAQIKVWLSQITEKNMLKGATIVALTGILAAVVLYSNATSIEAPIAGVSGLVNRCPL